MKQLASIVVAFLAYTALPAQAGDVTVAGVHLCCGQCVKSAQAAFEGVEGVTGVAVDKDGGTVKFTAATDEAVKAGLQALAKAGYAGAAKHGDAVVKFPNGGAKKDAAADTVTVRGLHNCCGGCAKAIVGAVKGVEGVSEASCEGRVCTITGTNIKHSAIIAALHAAGLHGNLGEPKKKAE